MQFATPYERKPTKKLHFLDAEGEPLEGAEDMCEQHHKQACDVNNILKQYDKTGLLTHVNNTQAHYGDFTEINEYQTSLNMVIEAQNSFMELPSAIRKRFGNDPGLFIEFVTNPENASEMVEMGLSNAPVGEPEPLKVSVIEPAQPAE